MADIYTPTECKGVESAHSDVSRQYADDVHDDCQLADDVNTDDLVN